MTSLGRLGVLGPIALVVGLGVVGQEASADVTYVSAVRAVHGERTQSLGSPYIQDDSTTDFTYTHSVDTTVFSAGGKATLTSTLEPTRMVYSGNVYGSGDHASGVDFYGYAYASQTVVISIAQPTNLWIEGGTSNVAGPGGHSAIAQYKLANAALQAIPTSPVLLTPGTYTISTKAEAAGSPSFALYGQLTFSYTIHFDVVPCTPDYNHSGSVTVQDIFDFLSGWFSGDPAADFNHAGGITVQDIFDFLSSWFTGC